MSTVLCDKHAKQAADALDAPVPCPSCIVERQEKEYEAAQSMKRLARSIAERQKLRDRMALQFAYLAIQALYDGRAAFDGDADIAQKAYEMADVMLLARGVTGEAQSTEASNCTCYGSQGGPDYCPVHAA